MKKFVLAACLLLPLVFCSQVTAAENPTQGWPASPDAEAAKVEIVAEPTLEPTKLRKGLTRQQRRDMGLTYRNVKRVLAELQADESVCFDDCCVEELAVLVAAELVADGPTAFQDPSLDWDAILAFIERLIPFIMTIISLFS